MKQKAKIFMMNPARSGQTMIDSQINQFLDDHPEVEIQDISYTMAGTYEKALVIFNELKTEKTEKFERQNIKNEGRKNYNQ